MTRIMRLAVCLCGILPALTAEKVADLKIQRENEFEFTLRPAVARNGDRIEIAFETKGFCDVTVAIEDGAGTIVRHLASGVLGPNAPEPFKPNSKQQRLVWDGKDEQNRYVDAKEALSVRVSLGLQARYERTLWWSPKRRTSEYGELKYVASSDGLYIWDKDSLRLHDHDGAYRRTLYPFPSKTLDHVKGLQRRAFPPEGMFPVKYGTPQDTLLTIHRSEESHGWPGGGNGATATAVAVHGKRVILIHKRVNVVGPDGGDVSGPEVTFPVELGTIHTFKGGTYQIPPQSAALSPDGNWLYLAGYLWHNSWRQGSLNGVVRLEMKPGAKPECFLGSMEQGKHGASSNEFDVPSSVACDKQGRIYVTDYKNHRLQIFTPEGKLAKSVKIEGAAQVKVDPKSGEIWVFSWSLKYTYSDELAWKGKPAVRKLASFEDPKVTATYPLDIPEGFDAPPAAEIDPWAKPFSIWISPARPSGGKGKEWWMQANLRQYVIDGEKLELKQDFAQESAKEIVRSRPARHERQRLYFNPKRKLLYAGDQHQPAVIHSKSFSDLMQIDPQSGKIEVVNLPFDAEDMAFDMEGHAYLRTVDTVARFDGDTWREVPFDYGDEFDKTSSQGFRGSKTISTLVTVGGENSSLQYGGMAVSPLGHLLTTYYLPGADLDRKDTANVAGVRARKYQPQVYPGRKLECVQHVWDKSGKMLHEDAVPGFRRTVSVGIDRDDNLYLMTDGVLAVDGKPHPNPGACTIVKVKPNAARVLTAGGEVPLPLGKSQPQRAPDLLGCLGPDAWIEGHEWMFTGVGIDAKRQHCHCTGTSQIALDYFRRTFAPEIGRYGVVLLDANGNAILRIGRYGNVDEGKPLLEAGSPKGDSIGGDEVALFNPRFVATETDRRLFIADPGNGRILSVKLDYHETERIKLRDVKDRQTVSRDP